jgi:hypothetical protein
VQAAGVAMLACLLLVGMVTIQPRGLFAAASRAGVQDPAVTSTDSTRTTDTLAATPR